MLVVIVPSVARTDPPGRPPKAAKHEVPSTIAAPGSQPGMEGLGETDISDDDPTQGEWLFKQDELVLGPVSAIVLVEKIQKRELSADTPIARDGQPFRPMKLVRLFREAWLAVEQERRLAAEEKAYRRAMTRARVLGVFVVLALFAAPFAAAAAGARALMVARPWDDTSYWIARVPPLVDLPQKLVEIRRAEGKLPAVADQGGVAADEDADEDQQPRDPSKPQIKKIRMAASDPKNRGTEVPKADGKKDPDKPAGTPPDTLTNAEAIAPLKGAQADMKACFKAEMESNPDMPALVVLSYTVTEEGKAININLDARELRGRPVVACVQTAINNLKWPRFTGERKNVSVPFKLGKPPAAKR